MIQQQGIFFCITDHIGGRSDNREAIMLDHFGEAGTAKLLKILKAKTMRSPLSQEQKMQKKCLTAYNVSIGD